MTTASDRRRRRTLREEPARQKNDAAWFKCHPRRTHRLRPAFSGELASWPSPIDPALRENCAHYFVIRQLGPGLRARLPSFWSKGSSLPASEEFAHALFDFLVQASQTQRPLIKLTRDDIETLARRYQTGARVL